MGTLSKKDKRLFILSPFAIFSKAGVFLSVLFLIVVLLRCFTAYEKRETAGLLVCFQDGRVRGELYRIGAILGICLPVLLLSRHLAGRIVAAEQDSEHNGDSVE
jgi:hypothetical protein